MTIEQLVKELESPVYKSEEKKIERVKKYLRTDYMEYHTKMSVSKQILEQARYHEVDGKKVYSPNGALEYELKVIALIQIYYKDIELREGADRAIDFNLLEKNNITSILFLAVGDDIARFNVVYNLTASDLAYKESFVPWIQTKCDVLGTVLGKWTETFDNPAIKEKLAALMANERIEG